MPDVVCINAFINLPRDFFEEVRKVVSFTFDLDLTNEALIAILNDSRLAAKILYFNEVETEIREDLADAVMDVLLGRAASTYGQRQSWEQLLQALYDSAYSKGWLTAMAMAD